MADFIGVELARTGTFDASTGKLTLTVRDFDEAERAYKALRGKFDPPIKLGHDDDQKFVQEDGLPSAGWVRNVRRQGNFLLGDYFNVPDKIAALMKSGRMAKRSIEAVRNYEIEGKRWPFVITGLALLGADLPAVTGLADIAKLYASAGIEQEPAVEDSTPVYVFAQDKIKAKRGPETDPEGDHTMNEKLLKLARKMLKLDDSADEAAIRDALKVATDADEDAIFAALHDLPVEKPEPTAEEAAAAKAAADKAEEERLAAAANESDVVKLRAEIEAERKARLEGETARVLAAAEADVESAILAGKFKPAIRASMVSMAVGTPEAFAELVKATADHSAVPEGESGHGGDDNEETILAEHGLTTYEKAFIESEELDPDSFLAAKLTNLGKPIPKKMAERIEAKSAERIKAAREAVQV